MATNHLGPHLLTTSLLPILAINGTVVTISSDSNLHANSMEDLNSEREYRPHTIYARWNNSYHCSHYSVLSRRQYFDSQTLLYSLNAPLP